MLATFVETNPSHHKESTISEQVKPWILEACLKALYLSSTKSVHFIQKYRANVKLLTYLLFRLD